MVGQISQAAPKRGGQDFYDGMPIDKYANEGRAKVRLDQLFGSDITFGYLENINNLIPELASDLKQCGQSKPWFIVPRELKKGEVTSTFEVNEDLRQRLADQIEYEIRIGRPFYSELLSRAANGTDQDKQQMREYLGFSWLHELVRCRAIELSLGQEDEKIQSLSYELSVATDENDLLSFVKHIGFGVNRNYKTKSQLDKKSLQLNMLKEITDSTSKLSERCVSEGKAPWNTLPEFVVVSNQMPQTLSEIDAQLSKYSQQRFEANLFPEIEESDYDSFFATFRTHKNRCLAAIQTLASDCKKRKKDSNSDNCSLYLNLKPHN